MDKRCIWNPRDTCLYFASVSSNLEVYSGFNVPAADLLEMSKFMRDADANMARPSQITANYQGHIETGDTGTKDNAPEKFFTRVDPKVFDRPSYKQFFEMMDNFYKELGKAEPRVSKREINFGQTLFPGHPFAESPSTFRSSMKQLWFDHYSRALGVLDSSGFEHIFMGEVKGREVFGMHNWVRFFWLEGNSAENFDYKGYILKRGVRGNKYARLFQKQLWGNALKRAGSTLLIGTSPEYCMALFTMCFLSRRGNRELCEVEVDGIPISITSFDVVQGGKAYIGSIYPSPSRRGITVPALPAPDGRQRVCSYVTLVRCYDVWPQGNKTE
ncbi:endoribonuclease XendoU [Oesophagostomum dentatum]|uniref:Endoribonuclease XendoU n=1 Tax=Oesophagostomum dentatum TaxID=61180 RepID=A0A0B1TPS2_OESDE|nr:endoribonuclease XendoU [Oesophagostomum dentatum]